MIGRHTVAAHPVVQFNNQVVSSFIRTKLDVHNPVIAELLNLGQPSCFQVLSTLQSSASSHLALI